MDILERPVPEHKRFFRAASVIRQGHISPLSRFQLPNMLPKRVLPGRAADLPPSSRWAVFCVVTALVTVCDGKCDGLSP